MKKTLLTIAIVFIAFISSCATDDFEEIVGVCPVVSSTNPADDATAVPLNQIITVNFNEEMNPETIDESSVIITAEGAPVSGTISYSGTTATFTPTDVLLANTIYSGRIRTLVKDVDGNALQTDYVWTFKTDVAPIVTFTDPFNDATAVPLNKVISATFNVPMNLMTLNATTFTVRQGAITILGTISPNSAGTMFTFTPVVPLAGNTLYTVTITTGAQNTLGTALASNHIWNFRTLIPVISPVNTFNGLGFGVFGGNAGITNQGLFTVVNGSMGTTAVASTVTGFTDGTNGDTYIVTPLNNGLVTNGIFADAPAPGSASKAATALAGLNAARALYLSISPAQMPGGIAAASELGGLTLAPGIYTAGSSLAITSGDLTLDAQGDPNAKWYFQAPSTLTVGSTVPRSVKFLNGVGNPNNVYWYVGTAAVINYAGGGIMTGNIIANSGVTLSSPANSTNASVTILNGRAISLVASVTMVNTVINVPN
ncbi:MAG: hypothetical protein B7Y83_05865 [Flavobacteriales bacterium 32-34-25]|nr:MAG: hypothetical protein B7Y83_05865 [Flavobacteriales bacterium 32-34-25]